MIKNKNGQEYKISKPNPLMKYQELWSLYTIHNFFWNEKVEKNIKEILETKENIENIKEIPLEKINTIKDKQTENVEKITHIEDKNKQLLECFYLKAETIIKKDNLYNEEKKEIKYTERTVMSIDLIEYNDLYLIFFCNKELSKDSIVFPKNSEKRWWKINKINKKENIYECLPSDFTPSFD